jgi:hypothetical protein
MNVRRTPAQPPVQTPAHTSWRLVARTSVANDGKPIMVL